MNDGLIIDQPTTLAPVQDALPPNDLRHAMMTLPVERQQVMLTEYKARRDNFRIWLLKQMERGVHYGIPPGCEPRGNVRPEQWQSQPSLYAAGADLLCDLLGLRAEFSADIEAWQQFGSKPGYIIIVCKLYSRQTGEIVGEGRGARKEGQKGGDANNALKMAQKSAKVDAILNGYGLRDVFTQDLEVPIQPLHDNPESHPDAPSAKPRAQRKEPAAVTDQDLEHLISHWKAANPDPDGDLTRQGTQYKQWAMRVCDRVFNARKVMEWTRADYQKCLAALGLEDGNG